MEDDQGWRPESANDSDESPKIADNELKRLASEIGINYAKPRHQTVLRNRPTRQRKKPIQYTPCESIRDFRGAKKKRQLDLCKTENRKRKNVFGGVNAKKQRSFFGEGFAQSVHKPLDVYNGKLYLSVPTFTFSFLNTLLIINNYSPRNSRKKG